MEIVRGIRTKTVAAGPMIGDPNDLDNVAGSSTETAEHYAGPEFFAHDSSHCRQFFRPLIVIRLMRRKFQPLLPRQAGSVTREEIMRLTPSTAGLRHARGKRG